MTKTELYKEVETVNEIKKPVTEVHFNSDYDVTELLTLWGNWARKEAYLQRKSPSLFKSECDKFKESLSDGDGIMIDSLIASLGRLKTKKSQDEFTVLNLCYFGEITLLDDTVMIITKSLRAIAKRMECSEASIRHIKSSAESCIVGMMSMQTMLTGQELELLQRIRVLK